MPTSSHRRPPGPVVALQVVVSALLDLVLPGRCAGCDAPARAPLCAECSRRTVGGLWRPPRVVAPRPRPPGLPPVVATAPYAGVLRRLLTAYKDDGRRDLEPLLGALLARSLTVVASGGTLPLVVVPVPSSRAARRRRGDAPLTELARRATRPTSTRAGPVVVVDALRVRRRVADQSGLGRQERAANLAGAYAVRPRRLARLAGCSVVLVDDVVTTGATLAEAARALRDSGIEPLAVATIAATRRRGTTGARAEGAAPRAPDPLGSSREL